ncbi:MAG: YfhO family protein [Verrucomicrobia bacterium]|nr:YfhO family protein [Verrucomicrobiota bacterium]
MTKSSAPAPGRNYGGFFLLLACLVATLSFLFSASFDPGQALFANDGPYGVLMSNTYKLPGGFMGVWSDLFWLGANSGTFSPNPTGLLLFGLGRRMFVNFYTPLTSLLVGLSAWFFFRQLRLKPWICVLGGLAAALNMNFFSNACWGLGTRNTSLACTFLALAAVQSGLGRFSVIKMVLAGLCIGMSISEGGDNGAIFSLFVAAYAFFLAVTQPGSLPVNAAKGAGKVLIMAVCAGIMALQSLVLFKNVAVTNVKQQDMTAAQRWDWATQWSLSKAETLRVIIPGLYGYRLDTPNGGNYWGRVGQQPGWEQHHQGFPRHSGAGEYAGVLVVLVALWGLANSFSRKSSAFDVGERRAIQFWGLLALIAMLLSWGRYAPFYRLVYALPYFASIRNPMKFMHPFHMILMILFAYGLHGLARQYLQNAVASLSLGEHIKAWWAKATRFEKSWNYGCMATIALGLMGFLVYSAARADLAKYLTTVGFDDARLSTAIAAFSAREVLLFVVFLTVSAGVLLVIQSGALAGRRSRWAGILLGTILVIDLVRADTPWIQYFTIEEKYATNPVLDVLKEKPWQHRVTVPRFNISGLPPSAQQFDGMLQQVYHIEWLQHHFQLFNIQAIEVAQMPRVPEDYAAFYGGSPIFAAHEFGDLAPFVAKLKQTNEVSKFVLSSLSEPTRQALQNFPSPADPAVLKAQLAKELTRLIEGPSLYDAKRFAGVPLSRKTEELLGLKPAGRDLVCLNRLLLEDAFPAEFTRYAGTAPGAQQLRHWQLTNTRYIIALSGFAEAFNAQVDPVKKRFRNALTFEIGQRPGGGITALENANGPYALIEFTGTLPRASLYPQWLVSTNDEFTLKRLGDPAFDPEQSVLVAENVSASTASTNAAPAAVEFKSYTPRRIELRATAAAPSVLLLNNRYDANWKVLIDGKPAPLLRCNFVMQGVQVPPGQHDITFRFAPPANGFWLMFGCVILGLLLCGFLLLAEKKKAGEGERE